MVSSDLLGGVCVRARVRGSRVTRRLALGERVNLYVGLSLVLVVVGAVMAGATDLDFNLEGYGWMVANCVCTAGYVLYLRAAVETKLSTWDKALLNNLLSLPTSLLLGLAIKEVSVSRRPDRVHARACVGLQLPDSLSSKAWSMPFFVGVIILSGLTGFCLNLASLWCIEETSATTYSMVGALNKVPSSIIGIWVFGNQITWTSGMFIAFGLLSGAVYAYAKSIDPDQGRKLLPVVVSATAPRDPVGKRAAKESRDS
jgi:GDP-mannose transporter